MFFNKYLIGVVMHQMVSRGYNVFDMTIGNFFVADENGNILYDLDSESYCRIYCGIPCCTYCRECLE